MGLRPDGNFEPWLYSKPVQTESAVRGGTRASVQNGTLRRELTPWHGSVPLRTEPSVANQTESHVRSGTRAFELHGKSLAQVLQWGRNHTGSRARSALDGEFRLYLHDWVCDVVRCVSSTVRTETSVTDGNVTILQ